MCKEPFRSGLCPSGVGFGDGLLGFIRWKAHLHEFVPEGKVFPCRRGRDHLGLGGRDRCPDPNPTDLSIEPGRAAFVVEEPHRGVQTLPSCHLGECSEGHGVPVH